MLMVLFFLELDKLLLSKIERENENGQWYCRDCGYSSFIKQRLMYHVEAKHVVGPGHECNICLNVLPTKNALNLHRSRKHRNRLLA